MKKKILIAPNSFKECADSVAIAGIISKELISDDFELVTLPLSDGGDGFLEVCRKYFNLELLEYQIETPYENSTLTCQIGYDSRNQRIYIESAHILGLRVIPKEKRHPMVLSSKGMGQLLNEVIVDVDKGKLKVKEIFIGIGGTGTNDMGLGAFEPFGLKIKDENNSIMQVIPANFTRTKKLCWGNRKLPFSIKLITDVNNSLVGKNGATMIFGKQKGLSDKEMLVAENGFYQILKFFDNLKNIFNLPNSLSGAGGGLAAGFQIFAGAELISSKEFITEFIKSLDLTNLDSVITGEGAFDSQSLNQKAIGILIKIFEDWKVPIIVICGKYDHKIAGLLPSNVHVIEMKKYFKDEQESIDNFVKGIALALKEIHSKFLN